MATEHLYPNAPEILATVSRKRKNKWKVVETYYRRPSRSRISFDSACELVVPLLKDDEDAVIFNLSRGGQMIIKCDAVDEVSAGLLQLEMLEKGKFRRYKIQGGYEPRVHVLTHARATKDFSEPQPGYRYGGMTTLKSHPLNDLPLVKKLASELKKICDVPEWEIGVELICYRGGTDKIGLHADDDQGEKNIATVVVDGPAQDRRKILVQLSKQAAKAEKRPEDERIEFFLGPGDMYTMDGAMQENYVHSVPQSSDSTKEHRRLSIVCRHGQSVVFKKDSGEIVTDLEPPRKRQQLFGDIEGLNYGDVCNRLNLIESEAHILAQRSVSGNLQVGCTAIILSGTRQDGLEWDAFVDFVYAVESEKGALSLMKSCAEGLPVRVFRTSRIDENIQRSRTTSQGYRFDGLYTIFACQEPANPKDPYLFYLAMKNLNVAGANAISKNSPQLQLPYLHFRSRPSSFIPRKHPVLYGGKRMSKADFDALFKVALETCSKNMDSLDPDTIGANLNSLLSRKDVAESMGEEYLPSKYVYSSLDTQTRELLEKLCHLREGLGMDGQPNANSNRPPWQQPLHSRIGASSYESRLLLMEHLVLPCQQPLSLLIAAALLCHAGSILDCRNLIDAMQQNKTNPCAICMNPKSSGDIHYPNALDRMFSRSFAPTNAYITSKRVVLHHENNSHPSTRRDLRVQPASLQNRAIPRNVCQGFNLVGDWTVRQSSQHFASPHRGHTCFLESLEEELINQRKKVLRRQIDSLYRVVMEYRRRQEELHASQAYRRSASKIREGRNNFGISRGRDMRRYAFSLLEGQSKNSFPMKRKSKAAHRRTLAYVLRGRRGTGKS